MQSLGQGLHEVLEKSSGKQSDSISESGVFLFFSFDLSDSTAFKNEHLSLWSIVFTSFYGKILECLGVENYKTPNSNYDDSICVRRLWKLIGDEVLIYVYITEWRQLYKQVTNVGETLSNLMDEIANEVARRSRENSSQCHCQDIKELITSMLGIKVTAWVAECFQDNLDSTTNVPNIIYSPVTTMSERRNDFLGRDIDEGFRIAKYAVKNRIIISPLLAWLIWKKATENEDDKKVVALNFKITAFIRMKGVWRNRKVPIIMFHQKFDSFMNCLEYDDLDLETYSNIKESGLSNFVTDERFYIERIDSIFENVHRKKEAEKLYQKLENAADVQVTSSKTLINRQEFHIACIIFDQNGRILVHNDQERGREFGCIKKIFGGRVRSWKAICEEGYKEKYGISIEVDQHPTPVATYYYEPNNALGLIVIARYAGTEEISGKSDWEFYETEELESATEAKGVKNFIENIHIAVQIKGDMDGKKYNRYDVGNTKYL